MKHGIVGGLPRNIIRRNKKHLVKQSKPIVTPAEISKDIAIDVVVIEPEVVAVIEPVIEEIKEPEIISIQEEVSIPIAEESIPKITIDVNHLTKKDKKKLRQFTEVFERGQVTPAS